MQRTANMPLFSIKRTLWHESDERRIELNQEQLFELEAPLVILGEAGMGKSHLLKQLGHAPDGVFCTARKLIASQRPENILGEATILIIDALDEVSGKRDGAALDEVLATLERLDNPKFILSCRVADWQSAAGASLIEEFYENKPLILHLNPFQDTDVLEYLSSSLDKRRAALVIEHFKKLGLNQLLGNPQTLSMIADISDNNHLPENREEVYKLAVENLASEHNDNKETVQLAKGVVIDTAGASFAGLILTGSEAIVRKAVANINQGDLSLADLSILSSTDNIRKATTSRLFVAIGNGRFSYVHRSIGEYLGARWLAKHADTPRKKRRLLSLFQSYGVVPANLRGIHSWLIQDSELAQHVLEFDPMGVIEYSGTDNLNLDQSKTLLDALIKLANENPRFREWKSYSIQGIIHKQLLPEIISLCANKNKPFSLRMLLIEALKGSSFASLYEKKFNQLLMDSSEIFAIRRAASDVLIAIENKAKWPDIARTLYELGDNDSLRLTEEFLNTISFEGIHDEFIVSLVLKYAEKSDSISMKLYCTGINTPIERIPNILNKLSEKLPVLGEWYDRAGNRDISELTCTLICRIIEETAVSPQQLWHWLNSIKPQVGTPPSETQNKLGKLIDSTNNLRQQIHLSTLLSECSACIPSKHQELVHAFPALAVNENDIIGLLQHLTPSDINDIRWKDLLQLYNHRDEHGRRARLAAQEFAKLHQGGQTWLDALASPPPVEWEIKQAQRIRQAEITKTERIKHHREEYLSRINDLKAGKSDLLIGPSQAYLKKFSDIGQDLPAHERIADWLGDNIATAAFIGIEAYLKSEPFEPDDIAKTHAENEYYKSEYVLITAIAERIRKGVNIKDLSDKTILVCLFSIWQNSGSQEHAKVGDVKKILEEEVKDRNFTLGAYRQYIEPQLALNKESVSGLYFLMSDKYLSEIACELAFDWLFKFTTLLPNTELILLKKLIQSGYFLRVQEYLLKAKTVDDVTQKRNRLAAQLLVDFKQGKIEIGATPEAELLWNIQDQLPHQREVELMEWVVCTYRQYWPYATHPIGISSGTKNSWDASEFLSDQINQLASSTSDEAVLALQRLKNQMDDGYSNLIKSVIAQQRQRIVEEMYLQPELKTINSIVRGSVPTSIDDLQAYMIEELAVTQAKIKADDVESWQAFFDDSNIPHKEERCRDHLLGLLRQSVCNSVELLPESHVAGDKEVDIACSVSGIRLPIEVKGQWHPDLWKAADKQLDKLYATDHLAEGRGIYLVLWFGPSPNKKLQSRGRGKVQPQTAIELRGMLEEGCLAAKIGRIKVVVLDIERVT